MVIGEPCRNRTHQGRGWSPASAQRTAREWRKAPVSIRTPGAEPHAFQAWPGTFPVYLPWWLVRGELNSRARLGRPNRRSPLSYEPMVRRCSRVPAEPGGEACLPLTCTPESDVARSRDAVHEWSAWGNSNPHYLASETRASTVWATRGWSGASGGPRTRTDKGLGLAPLPIGLRSRDGRWGEHRTPGLMLMRHAL